MAVASATLVNVCARKMSRVETAIAALADLTVSRKRTSLDAPIATAMSAEPSRTFVTAPQASVHADPELRDSIAIALWKLTTTPRSISTNTNWKMERQSQNHQRASDMRNRSSLDTHGEVMRSSLNFNGKSSLK